MTNAQIGDSGPRGQAEFESRDFKGSSLSIDNPTQAKVDPYLPLPQS